MLHIRRALAKNIVVSLEFLVAADVIETLALPVSLQSLDALIMISIIVVLRTVLSLHLAHELKEIEETLHMQAMHTAKAAGHELVSVSDSHDDHASLRHR
eukprot:PLAT11714.2.p2 GENE.PLAT11714.2~~PLAT11714.2.p2  ORF type:complete len:100 (-),score=32.32 PLAT11714.2:31-330(-)